MKSIRLSLLFALAGLFWVGTAAAAKIQFKFSDRAGPSIRVFLTRPVKLAPDRPIVFVMHGVKRNAAEYRDQWHELANEYDFLLVVPEFSRKNFPGSSSYNLGNILGPDGNISPSENWTYSAIEPLFDEVRRRFRMTTGRYSLYGHSAGAQFVQRFIFHVPHARVNQVVSANAGWYMMPDFETDFPYGLNGSGIDREMLAAALQLPVTLLLGEKDTDPDDPNLRRTPEALVQGENRLKRGMTFFQAAKDYAAQRNLPFSWKHVKVPGADHDNRLMAPAAVDILIAE